MKHDAQPQRADTTVDQEYPVRVSEVGQVCLISISSSAIAQFGDRAEVNASLRGLAVQRETDHLLSGDVYFESYNIFNRPVPPTSPWLTKIHHTVPFEMQTTNREPSISVGRIEVIAVSSSALVLIGNGVNNRSESRISNIRQYAAPLVQPIYPGY